MDCMFLRWQMADLYGDSFRNNMSPQFTVMNHASTFWYHPHLHMRTGEQAMRGAAGVIIVRDPEEAVLALPRTYGVDDFPLIVQSQQFDSAQPDHGEECRQHFVCERYYSTAAGCSRTGCPVWLLQCCSEPQFQFWVHSESVILCNREWWRIVECPGSCNTHPSCSGWTRGNTGWSFHTGGTNALSDELCIWIGYRCSGWYSTGEYGKRLVQSVEWSRLQYSSIECNRSNSQSGSYRSSALVNVVPWTAGQADTTRNISFTAQSMMNLDGPFYLTVCPMTWTE